MLDGTDHVAGPARAPYELVMYGDFQCPYCTAAQSILRRVRERLDGQLRFGFRHFPLTEVHPDAWRAAEASEAAAAQGSFWDMHDALFANGGRFGVSDLVVLADRLGLDVERLASELASGVYAPRVQRDVDSGRALGVTGTPTFFVNGVLHTESFDARSLVDALTSDSRDPRLP